MASKSVYDSTGNAFYIDANGKLVMNDVVDTYTNNVQSIVVSNGTIYQSALVPEGTSGTVESWYKYTPGSGWHNWTKVDAPATGTITDTTDPASPDDTPSPDGSTATPGGVSLYDAYSNSLSINENHQIVVNGVVDVNTKGVSELVIEDGSIYQSAAQSNGTAGWYQYTPGSGWNNWTKVDGDPRGSDPSTPSTPTTPTTPTTPSTPSTPSNDGFPAHWARLDNGLNIERSEIPKISDSELKKLAASGVENIRIFMSPDDGYLTNGKPMDPENSGYVKYFADFMHRVNDAGMAVIITPFGGASRPAWQSNPNDQASINQYVSWYKEFASYLKNHFSYKDVFIESQAEPFMNDPAAWWKIEDQFVKAVHSVAPEFTFVSSSNGKNFSQWDYISSLVDRVPHADTNVVYNIHDYVPMNFTHQGQTWMGSYWGNLKNIQYTTQDAANTAKDFATLAAWAEKYGVKVTVNEFGSSQTAAESERAEFMADVRQNAEKYGFGWDVWDFNKGFSISTTDASGDEVVKDIYQKALTWGKYQDSGSGYTSTTTTTTNSTNSTTSSTTTSNTSSSTTSTQPTTLTKTLDAQFAASEKIAFSASDLGKSLIVKNFDATSGTTGIQDRIDLSEIFKAIGGKFVDGVNDVADRTAALTFTTGDFDNDGHKNDLKIGITGNDKFSLTLIAPTTVDKTWYEVSDSGHAHSYDNIWIA